MIISIHAAQEGCDFNLHYKTIRAANFNPRSPRGLRLKKQHNGSKYCNISIHAAQEGCDPKLVESYSVPFYFNPRSPRGLRLGNQIQKQSYDDISIHAAQEGCDTTQPKRAATVVKWKLTVNKLYFNPRSPRGLRRLSNGN